MQDSLLPVGNARICDDRNLTLSFHAPRVGGGVQKRMVHSLEL